MNKRLFARVIAGCALGAALLLTGCENADSDPGSPLTPSQEIQPADPAPYVPSVPLPIYGVPGSFIFI